MNDSVRKIINNLEQQLILANKNIDWHRKQWRIYEEQALELKLHIDAMQKLAK
jgi:hypothetical protein